ncbi:MAG: hypothetical protein GOMPHAMPRED_002910 [Gomphillus americanus]|uniref:Telomere length regulation protein conserved domain-containing protein n=1 Tax=Gomphillus americanus TaxID=1940652 RepID=A0A8H3ECP4_9LECA|nr:MAG: hypothetical protein GOMPHAMPRED_002910 [Gomphillus americanus]
MDSLLSISSSKGVSEVSDAGPVEVLSSRHIKPESTSIPTTTRFFDAKEVLHALQNRPSLETLSASLKWLSKPGNFRIKAPGPLSTEIIASIVNDVVPHFWPILREKNHSKERRWLLYTLTSVSGLGALLARLKLVLRKNPSPVGSPKKDDINDPIQVLEVLDALQQGDTFLTTVWADIQQFVQNPTQRTILWKELVSILASGRLLSVAAEALNSLDSEGKQFSWLGEGSVFTKWLGENINTLARNSKQHGMEALNSAALMLGKALSLGYRDGLIATAFHGMLSGDITRHEMELGLHNRLNSVDQTRAVSGIILQLNHKFTSSKKVLHHRLISGSSALIKDLCGEKPHLKEFLLNWLICDSGGCVGTDLGLRRAVITAISTFEGYAQKSIRKLLVQFGDKIHIQHVPIIVQEVCSQNLLLLAGRIFRLDRNQLHEIARSSIFINAISNRLAASVERARFLGMVTGMSVSELVDSADKRMKFSVDTINSADTDWYMALTGIQDSVGSLKDLEIISHDEESVLSIKTTTTSRETRHKQPVSSLTPVTSKIIAIEEIESSDEDDIPHYQKPDSDASDSDEDPTLINRNKPTPPVYIRDLITYLKDTENHDRHTLAMSHASSLIRRKSSYGTEVKDYIEDLASLLCGLKDEYDIGEWQKQRIAAMVAIILAEPIKMGKWFADMSFSGDYSIAQRASMLTAVTLAARELAGYAEEDTELTNTPHISDYKNFPSKQLPPKYEKLYLNATDPLKSAAYNLETKILAPLAASAADRLTGPSILKTRTFSSRLAVESRKKPITNKLATLLTDHFFFPLTNRWRIYTLTHGTDPKGSSSSSSSNIFSTPLLQTHLLKTLSLLLAAAGPGTISLPTLTTEFWSILLSRPILAAAREALPVLEAVLFGLLTLLEVNGAGVEGEDVSKRRLAEECGEALVETRAWVGVVMEGTVGGRAASKEEERVGMLAAAVLIRVEEVVERYQRLLIGALAGV